MMSNERMKFLQDRTEAHMRAQSRAAWVSLLRSICKPFSRTASAHSANQHHFTINMADDMTPQAIARSAERRELFREMRP